MSLVSDLEHFAGRIAADVEHFVEDGVQALEKHAEEHPQPLFSLLRAVHPVLVIGDIAVITRYPDVLAVLTDDQAFGVERYGRKMRALTGDFILGLDPSERYEHDVTLLRLAAPSSDAPGLAAFANDTAEELVAAGVEVGQIDAAEISRRLPARLMAHWFGTPGPDEETMIRWALTMFEDIFINVKDDPAIHARAKQSADELGAYLGATVAERKAAGPLDREDVLGRLITMQAAGGPSFTDAEIVSNLVGLIVGFIPTVATATPLAIDDLLDRPGALETAQRAARADDVDTVRAHMWEAMRLAPQAPGLLRQTRTDAVLAEGTHHAKQVSAGTTVFAATESAMLDGDVIEHPNEFRVPRPSDHYLHFGAGMHECFGRFVNEVQIPAIAKAILRLPNLARAPGEQGKLVKEGPYPKSLALVSNSASA